MFEVISAHKTAPIPNLVGDLAKFDPLIQGLLNKDPNQRIQSANEALSILARLKV